MSQRKARESRKQAQARHTGLLSQVGKGGGGLTLDGVEGKGTPIRKEADEIKAQAVDQRAAYLLRFKGQGGGSPVLAGLESKGNAGRVTIVDILQDPKFADMRDELRREGATLPPEMGGSPWQKVNHVSPGNTGGFMADVWHLTTKEQEDHPIVRTPQWEVLWGVEVVPNRGGMQRGGESASAEPAFLFRRRSVLGDVWATAYPIRQEYLLMWDNEIWDHRKDEFISRTLEMAGLPAWSDVERRELMRVAWQVCATGLGTMADDGEWQRICTDLERMVNWGSNFVVSRDKFLEDGDEKPHFMELTAFGESRRGDDAEWETENKHRKIILPPSGGGARAR